MLLSTHEGRLFEHTHTTKPHQKNGFCGQFFNFWLMTQKLSADFSRRKFWLKNSDAQDLSIPQGFDCYRSPAEATKPTPTPFNPTMVRLLPSRSKSPKTSRQPFNPTMVRLLRSHDTGRRANSTPFNPTMVRLLPPLGSVANSYLTFFQSHNGSIATGLPLRAGDQIAIFQSHNGSIATWLSVVHAYNDIALSIPQWFDCYFWKAACQVARVHLSIPQWFDCYGRNQNRCQLPNLLSIPQWFDCYPTLRIPSVADQLLSIPQWFDCYISEFMQVSLFITAFNPTMVRLLPGDDQCLLFTR